MKEVEIKIWKLNSDHRTSWSKGCSAYISINNEEFFASLVNTMDHGDEIMIFPSKNEQVTDYLEVYAAWPGDISEFILMEHIMKFITKRINEMMVKENEAT